MSTEERCLLVLVEHGFLFYVSSTVNFEKLPADAEDVENQDYQTRHPKDLTQAARQRKESKRILVNMIHQTFKDKTLPKEQWTRWGLSAFAKVITSNLWLVTSTLEQLQKILTSLLHAVIKQF